MKFTAIFALAALTAVNALALDRRGVPECAAGLTQVQSQLDVVTTGVNNWKVSDGYAGALKVQTEETKLEKNLDSAKSACTISGTVSEADADTILAQVDTLVPKVETALDSLVQKKSDFDQVLLVTALVTKDIKNLKTKTDALDNALLSATPASYKDRANAYVKRINDAFAAAYTAYGI
ncbi:hypothetical protein O0I10_012265 [Lichtheimia ornata]|uniref:Hydrophobic surface binding protein A-domain-containing protein n=1 Tax=Lichtheimia ornata TaxID=688661 RepID=A0AAD7XPQ7_9FUNG|nr:uncharacterized protein O0I10_012265 [Lichtheimia ornata]KAJ8652114.1 hypothetical protein O0I10_012265 [Lichtheimia ornata]